MKTVQEINQLSKKRAIGAIIFSLLTAILVYIGVTIRLFDSSITGNEGLATYRMFTIDSNVLVAVCAILCIPYEIDGIINNNYHMPRWIVNVLFLGTMSVTMTFVISLTILAPAAGFVFILFTGSNIFLHLICPICAIVLFIFVAHDHNISFKYTWFSLTGVIIYAIVYLVMVFIIGPDNGGWSDHYKFGVYIPWPVTLVLFMGIAFGLATGIRVAHNKVHKSFKLELKNRYQTCEELNTSSLEEAVRVLAREDKKSYKENKNISVPVRIIRMLMEKHNPEASIEELSKAYIDEFLK